jgi:hypothetical protein
VHTPQSKVQLTSCTPSKDSAAGGLGAEAVRMNLKALPALGSTMAEPKMPVPLRLPVPPEDFMLPAERASVERGRRAQQCAGQQGRDYESAQGERGRSGGLCTSGRGSRACRGAALTWTLQASREGRAQRLKL